jgi:hypothetical protein
MNKGLLIVSIAGAHVNCDQNVTLLGSLHGSGVSSTIVSPQRDFSGIALSHACKASIVRGDFFSVTVRIDDKVREYVHIERSNYDLLIHASGTITGDLSGGSSLRYTGSPTLGAIRTSGGSDVTTDELREP